MILDPFFFGPIVSTFSERNCSLICLTYELASTSALSVLLKVKTSKLIKVVTPKK